MKIEGGFKPESNTNADLQVASSLDSQEEIVKVPENVVKFANTIEKYLDDPEVNKLLSSNLELSSDILSQIKKANEEGDNIKKGKIAKVAGVISMITGFTTSLPALGYVFANYEKFSNLDAHPDILKIAIAGGAGLLVGGTGGTLQAWGKGLIENGQKFLSKAALYFKENASLKQAA